MRGSWHAESLLAINWNDADDNNAFHGKQIVMDLDGTISTEVAIIKKKQDYDDIETMGLALSNDGEPVPSEALHTGGLIPQGAKNVEIAKDFLKFLIQPEVLNAYLKAGLGRNIPCMLSIAKNDTWLADPHRAAYTKQGLLGPTVPNFWVYNPAYASVENEHVWPTAWTPTAMSCTGCPLGNANGPREARRPMPLRSSARSRLAPATTDLLSSFSCCHYL